MYCLSYELDYKSILFFRCHSFVVEVFNSQINFVVRCRFVVVNLFESTVDGDEGEEEDEADHARDESCSLDHDRVTHESRSKG